MIHAEFEYEIPRDDAEQLLGLSEGPVVEKRRHVIAHGGPTWEVANLVAHPYSRW